MTQNPTQPTQLSTHFHCFASEQPNSMCQRLKRCVPSQRAQLLLLLTILAAALWSCHGADSEDSDDSDESSRLSNSQLIEYAKLSDVNHLRETVHNIAVVRVVETATHHLVRDYIKLMLENLGWTVTFDEFVNKAPIFGWVTFNNIIAQLNPNAENYLVLACHYESKYMPEIIFPAAVDSAVPCSMMLNLAKVLQQKLEPLRQAKLSLMFLFFDGEEAFQEWSSTDSLYGSRHLALLWEKFQMLKRIKLFVLLDLIGSSTVDFYNNVPASTKWYRRLATLEKRMTKLTLLPQHDVFFNTSKGIALQDDHVPFMQRRVQTMHLISLPYPKVWHTAGDTEANVDYRTTEQVALVLRAFVLDYLL